MAINNQKNVNFHLKKDALHKEIHVAKGKKIPVSTLQHEKSVAKKDHNVKLEERVNFALNARHFHH